MPPESNTVAARAGENGSSPSAGEVGLRTAIIEFLSRHSRHASPPAAWESLGRSRWIRELSCEPAELQSRLTAKFAEHQLLEAGVLARRAAGDLVLSPTLAEAAKFFIQRDPNGAPVDIASARGSISSDGSPWFPLAKARRVNWIEPMQQILLSGEADDLHILHRLGYRVMTSEGLEQLSADQVKQMFIPFAVEANYFPYDFVLVGWRVADISAKAPKSLENTVTHLAEIPSRYGFNPWQRFKVWIPSAAEVRAVRAYVSAKDRSAIVRQLNASLKASRITPAGALTWVRDQVPLGYVAAQRRLQRAVHDSHEFPLIAEVTAALGQFRQAVRRDLIAKLEQTSITSDGPWTELGCYAATDLVKLYFESHPLVVAAERILAGEHAEYRPRLDDEHLTQRLKVVNTIVRIAAMY